MNDDELRTLLEGSTTIAVVGASTDPHKPSNRIPALLIEAGYTVIPVHPSASEILGQRAYPSLAEVPVHADIVDVFRPADETPGIARQAVDIGAKTLWLQLGIASSEAASIATASGLNYVEDRCIGETVQRLEVRPAGSAVTE